MRSSIKLTLLPSIIGLGFVALWLALSDDALFVLTHDDSFYYLELAKNTALGHGSTFDRIHQTNGYHPLWMWILVPLFSFGLDGVVAAKTGLIIQCVLFALALWSLVSASKTAVGHFPTEQNRANPGWYHMTAGLALLLIILNPFVLRTFINGMESLPYACLYTLLLVMLLQQGLFEGSTKRTLLLSVIASFTFLSRTDAILMGGWLFVLSLPEAHRRGSAGYKRLTAFFALPALTFVCFLVANQMMFETPIQVSGSLKRVPLTPLRLTAAGVLLAIPFVIGARLRSAPAGHNFARTIKLLRKTGWFGFFCCSIIAYYTTAQTFARIWYFGPIVIYGALVLLVALADLLDLSLSEDPKKPAKSALIPLIALVCLPLLAGLVWTGKTSLDPDFTASRRANRDAGIWLTKNVHHKFVLAGWDMGVVGYFAEQRVVNLDGVVNSYGYLNALKTGTTAEYLAPSNIDYVINHDFVEDNTMAADAADLLGADTVAGWSEVNSWPFTVLGTTNKAGLASKQSMAVFLYQLK